MTQTAMSFLNDYKKSSLSEGSISKSKKVNRLINISGNPPVEENPENSPRTNNITRAGDLKASESFFNVDDLSTSKLILMGEEKKII